MAELSRLPGPVIDRWEWQYEGACREAGSEQFFHPEGERGASRRRRDANAKAICSTCPVIPVCRRPAEAPSHHPRPTGSPTGSVGMESRLSPAASTYRFTGSHTWFAHN